MSKTDSLIETFREWVLASNPGLVTREDLARLEGRVDELVALFDQIEGTLKRDAKRHAGDESDR